MIVQDVQELQLLELHNIGKIPQMVLDRRRVKVREIPDAMKMSKERACLI